MSKTHTFVDGTQIINLTLEPGDHILPCPFCGGANIELCNTHTPSYWLACQTCGAEVGDPGSSRKDTMRGHRYSKRMAIAAWNRRTTPQQHLESLGVPQGARLFDDLAHPVPGAPRWPCTCGNWHSQGRTCPVGGGGR